MKTHFDVNKVIEPGKIQNELDFERALILDRKLKLLAKENSDYKLVREKLRDLIQDWENKQWSSESKITEEKIQESDLAEIIAEKERLFIERRKKLIKAKLKSLNLNQQDLGTILGHNNKSYMSELINGINPLSLRDLIVINRLLKIDLSLLVPNFLSHSESQKIKASIEKLNNPYLKLSKDDFAVA
jgi:antitoxin component HigA of HigAB toxin-antitoxin module